MRPGVISSLGPRAALLLGGLALAAMLSVSLLRTNERAQAQTPNCIEQPVGGVIPRCLVIVKQTNPDGSSQNFSFNINVDPPAAPSVNEPAVLQDNGSVGFALGTQSTPEGTVFTITETVPSGWSLASVSCQGAGITTQAIANGIEVTYTGNVGQNPFAYAVCTFTNQSTATPTPTATATATGTVATPTPTATATPTPIPPWFYVPDDRPNLGGLFVPTAPSPTRTPVTAAPAPPVTVRPPSTGDGGLQ